MTSIPSRRILATGALSAFPCLRAPRVVAAAAIGSSLRIAASPSSSSSSSSSRRSYSTETRTAALSRQTTQQQQRWGRQTCAGVRRRSTTSATKSKIWTFEEIQSLIPPPPPDPETELEPEPEPEPEPAPAQAQAEAPRAILIDVREPEELRETGRIPGALNVPLKSAPDSFHLSSEEFENRFGFARPGADDEVVFYCRAGVRSRAAAGLAREAGWTRVGEYPGSWMEWAAKGGAVER
ncbi:Rhodanese-like domain-containing protein [Nemania serpens]|nr:Rhodanese-like domain-containing protein [Nemania serpens]